MSNYEDIQKDVKRLEGLEKTIKHKERMIDIDINRGYSAGYDAAELNDAAKEAEELRKKIKSGG